MTKWVVLRYVWFVIALSYLLRAIGLPGFVACKVVPLLFAEEVARWAEANL